MSNTDGIKLRPSQLIIALKACISAKLRVLIKGPPGAGKTSLVDYVRNVLGAGMALMHPSVSDPTDYKGFPFVFPDGRAEFVPFGELRRIADAQSSLIAFMDDLGQAREATQAAVMQMLDRFIDHPHVVFVAATNRREDRAAVTGILEPVKSRFASILELEPNAEDWAAWAINNGMPPELIAYIRNVQPDALFQHKPSSADITNSPMPRTWAAVGKILGLNVDEDVRYALIEGAVGQAAAATFNAYRKMINDAPDLDDVIAHPKTAALAKEPSAQYVVACGLALRATQKNFGAISTYIERMHADEQGDMCAWLLRDALRRVPDLINHAGFVRLANTDLAALVAATTEGV